MGWYNVVYDPAGPNVVENQCAALLNNASPSSAKITGAQLNNLLQPDPGPNRYQEGGQRRIVFRVEAWTPGVPDGQAPPNPKAIEIAIVFRKTIKRKQPYVSTVKDPVNSPPQRRWWCLCIGCHQAANPNPDPYYPIVRDRCITFYKNLDTTIAEWLVILRCTGWVLNTAIEIDNLYLQMSNDPQVTLVPIPAETAYPPWDKICSSGQISGVRIIYTGP